MPLNNDKKRKLRKLLAKLSPEDKPDLIAKNLEEDIQGIGDRLSKIKDSSLDIQEVRIALIDLQQSLLDRISLLPSKESLDEVKKKYLENITLLQSELDDLGEKFADYQSKEETEKEIKDLKDDLEKLRLAFINRGGGSPNQQISVNGVVATTRYADINLIATGATISNDNTKKRTDINFGSGGSSSALPLNAIQLGDGAGGFKTVPNGGTTLDVTGNTRGVASLDIQSQRTAATQVANGACAVAIGLRNTASGTYSLAVGRSNNATNSKSVALGEINNATGLASLASGSCNTSSGFGSTTSGYCNIASANCATAIGFQNNATCIGSAAIGFQNNACGDCSAAIGYLNTSSALQSAAVGRGNSASANYASAFGVNNTSSKPKSTSYGFGNCATGCNATALGLCNVASSCSGYYFCGQAVAIGFANSSSGYRGTTVGTCNSAVFDFGTAIGYGNSSLAIGASASGYQNLACGRNSMALGYANCATACGATAIGSSSHSLNCNSLAIGTNTTASGLASSALGFCATASGYQSAAFGYQACAGGDGSLSLGTFSCASSASDSAIGSNNCAMGGQSTASGYYNRACGVGSTASGLRNTASGAYSTASGYYNTTSIAAGSGMALGAFNHAWAQNATAIGTGNNACAAQSSAFGNNNQTTGIQSTASGYYNCATGPSSLAIGGQNVAGPGNSAFVVGKLSTSSGEYSGVIGYGITNINDNTVEIGYTDSFKLQLNGVTGALQPFGLLYHARDGTPAATGSPSGLSFDDGLYTGGGISFPAFPASPVSKFDHNTDAGNTTTSETDLYSDTLAAGLLATNADKISAYYGGIFVSSGTATREVRLKFAGTTIFDTGALTLSLSSAWTMYVDIIRVSASVIRYMISFTTEGAALAAYTAVGELTGLTLSGTNILKITGQSAGVGAATNDVVAKMANISYQPHS